MIRRAAARLRLRDHGLREPVLERVVSALGARADLPLDRLSDAQLVGAVLVAGAGRHGPDDLLCIDLFTEGSGIELCVGPLPSGAAARMVAESALPGVGVVLERLVDEWTVDVLDAGSETLRLRIGAPAPSPR